MTLFLKTLTFIFGVMHISMSALTVLAFATALYRYDMATAIIGGKLFIAAIAFMAASYTIERIERIMY